MSRRPPDLPHQPPFRFVAPGFSGPKFASTAGEAGSEFVSIALLAEAMAQAILLADPPEDTHNLRLVGLDQVVLRQEVQPGDQVDIEVAKHGQFARLARYRCRMLRGGSVVAEGIITVGH